VSKNPQGLDEVVVQGDVTEEIVSGILGIWQRCTRLTIMRRSRSI
jgi:hypothetical protein